MTDTTHDQATAEAPDLADVDLVTVLQALSDPVRLDIVRQLAAGAGAAELACRELQVPVSKSTTSHHIKTLTAAGLVVGREEGTRKYLSLRRKELEERFPGLLDSVLRAADEG